VRITGGVVLWLVAAAAATAVGLFAVGAIGTDIFGPGQQPLSQSEVDRQLAESSPPTSSPPSPPAATTATTPPPTATTPAARTTTVRAVGGTVWARCAPGGVEVVGATPAQGFGVESDDDGVEDHPKITFVSGEREIEIRLRCAGGTVTHTVEED
jgi:hypothetical protein